MTWKRSVSMTLPGPMRVCHHTVASASPVSAWQMYATGFAGSPAVV